MRIAVALSGGIDSAVTAHILARQGHEVIGLTMTLSASSLGSAVAEGAAASLAASSLGIEHHIVDATEAFRHAVIAPFLHEYANGRTPNPCVICNSVIKFGLLMDEAETLGADALATGHHARIARCPDGTSALLTGRDEAKDQSYFLYRLSGEQLARSLMPVGEITKREVRALADELGINVFTGRESADICFASSGGVAGFVRAEAPELLVPGPIEDAQGRVVGTHEGVALYTVGQRSGLGLAFGTRVYVTRIDAARNAVIVGAGEDLMAMELTAGALAWPSGSPPARDFSARAKVRYAARPTECSVAVDGDEARVVFSEAQRAIAPGQSVVFYDGDAVLGGGVIHTAEGSGE